MGARRSFFEHFLSQVIYNQRWIFVLLILPVSFLYDVFAFLWEFFVVNFSSPGKHDRRVRKLQLKIRAINHKDLNNSSEAKNECRTSQRKSSIESCINGLKSEFRNILEIDLKKNVLRVEPYVSIGQVSSVLFSQGFTLPVMPEVDSLCVGSLVEDIGFESSSHCHGLFKDICLGLEIMTADGEVRRCSETENNNLFHSIPVSNGTLGILVALELKIVPISPFVKLEYVPCFSLEETLSTLKMSTSNHAAFEFVEALVYSETSAVVVRGSYANPSPGDTINRLSHWWKPWFYAYVAKFLKNGPAVEFVPVRDYYRRHTRSFFWLLRDIIPFGNHWLFRFFFGWSSPPQIQLLKMTWNPTTYERTGMVQDMFIPVDALEKTLVFIFKNVKLFPIWLCPVKCLNRPGLLHPSTGKDELYVNVGTYGNVGISDYHPIECTRAYESFVRRLHGFQMLYTDSYQTRDEFSQMFDRSLYDEMRRKLPNCIKTFPDIFDKVNRMVRV